MHGKQLERTMSPTGSNTLKYLDALSHMKPKNEGCSFVKSYNTIVYTVMTCIYKCLAKDGEDRNGL